VEVEGLGCGCPKQRRPTWRCRDKSNAAPRREVDKMAPLQLGRDALGCGHDADGIGGPAETHARRGAALGVRERGYTMYVRDVAAVRNAELYEGIRNLAR
jgi:hypothetical protein